MVTVAWHKMCKPFDEGGLDQSQAWVRYAQFQSILGHLTLKIESSITESHLTSVWSSVKAKYPKILENSNWLLGTGENINFW